MESTKKMKMKKIMISVVAILLLAGAILFVAYQIPGAHVLGKVIHINVEQEFYQYDLDGNLMGKIPVKFKGILSDQIPNREEFVGVVEVEGYELQYVDESTSYEQGANVFFHYEEETDYVYCIISGWKLENTTFSFLVSDYQYRIKFQREYPDRILVRVGQAETETNEMGGSHTRWPAIFYAVFAESEEVAAELVIDELERLAQSSAQDANTELAPDETTTSVPEVSQETSPVQEVPEHLQSVGDVDGDGIEESVVLKEFDTPGTKASLWVDGEKVMDLQGQGELGEHTCRLVTSDVDKDGQDEVLVLIRVVARSNDASFRIVEWENGAWQELPKIQLPKMEMSLSDGWQCTLTEGARQWTVEVKNPTLRTEWFDETGAPVVGPMQVSVFTENADHIVGEGTISFHTVVTVRDLGEHGGSWDEIWGEPIVTISYEKGELVVNDILPQALLDVLTGMDE